MFDEKAFPISEKLFGASDAIRIFARRLNFFALLTFKFWSQLGVIEEFFRYRKSFSLQERLSRVFLEIELFGSWN